LQPLLFALESISILRPVYLFDFLLASCPEQKSKMYCKLALAALAAMSMGANAMVLTNPTA